MKSLKFFKPALATTLGIVLAWLLSVRPAQAGYTVTLQEVGPDVVATGSGRLDLTGLTFVVSAPTRSVIEPIIFFKIVPGPTGGRVDVYQPILPRFISGPAFFGNLDVTTYANSGSGDLVGMFRFGSQAGGLAGPFVPSLAVPTGYVSGTALSDSATYNNATLASLGVTPGTYVWTWGTGANQNFTLKILTPLDPGTATVADFNGDGHPDWVVRNAGTGQTAIWYLNNNVFAQRRVRSDSSGWMGTRGAADFNGDSHPDYGLFNSSYSPNSNLVFVRTNAHRGRFWADSAQWLGAGGYSRL